METIPEHKDKLSKPLPQMSGPKYEPKVGDTITVDLPNERTRARIEKVISDTAVIAKITQFTTGRTSHNYNKDDLIACVYETLSMNSPGWRVMSERELAEAEAAAEPPPPKKKRGK